MFPRIFKVKHIHSMKSQMIQIVSDNQLLITKYVIQLEICLP